MDLILALALTTHVNLSQDFNELHPHIRLQYDSFIVGSFFNSLEETSVYVGMTSDITRRLSVEYGATTGYNDIKEIVPFARLVYQTTDHTRMFFAPAVEDNRLRNHGMIFGVEVFF